MKLNVVPNMIARAQRPRRRFRLQVVQDIKSK